MTYAERLKAARKSAGLTQKQLAGRLQTNQATISDLETGKQLTCTFNASIAYECGVNALWLETGRGTAKNIEQYATPSIAHVVELMQVMEPEKQYLIARLADQVAEPAKKLKDGTNGGQ